MKTVRGTVGAFLRWLKVIYGFLAFRITGRTPGFAYQSMVALFCVSQGRSNDLISKIISILDRPYRFEHTVGVLGDMNAQGRSKVISVLETQGYYVFPDRLPDELCDKLYLFATTHPSKIRPMDGEGAEKAVAVVYDGELPQAVRYDFETEDLLANSDIQRMLSDFSFAAVAQDYLKTKPVIDVLSMWWHTAFSDKPDMHAAQYYHFDMDRPKWLKFFIYLTDVTPETGPHTFVSGSHQTGGIPSNLLKKGYARLTDEEVEAVYGSDSVVEFSAPRGTIIAEDTRGLHKGKHVSSGNRLILQIQFSNTLFGGTYPEAKLPGQVDSGLSAAIQKFPKLFEAYTG